MHLLPGTPLHPWIRSNWIGFKENVLPYPTADFMGVFCNNYKGIFARLNLSTFYSKRRNVDALFLFKVFKRKISSSISDTVNTSIGLPTTIIRYSTFIVITIPRSAHQLDVFRY
jgi:hypothetical protein